MEKKLRRVSDAEISWLGGVCAGVAYWLKIHTWIVRLVWFLVAFFYGFGLGLYIILWVFMPKWKETPEDYYKVAED